MDQSAPRPATTPPPHTLMLAQLPAWINNRPWLRRLLVAITGVSISTKIMGIVLALTMLMGIVVTVQVHYFMSKTLQGELHEHGLAVTKDLADRAAPLILTDDRAGLDTLLRATLANHIDSRYAFVLDGERQVLAHVVRRLNTISGSDSPYSFINPLPGGPDVAIDGADEDATEAGGLIVSGDAVPEIILNADLAESDAQNTHLHHTTSSGRIHDFVMPIADGAGNQVGIVRLAFAETRLNTTISDVTEQMVLTTLLVAGVGILAAMLLTWLLTRPILDLVTTTEQLRQGDLSVRAPRWNDDEIGALADAFNQMVSELEISQQTVIAKENARTHLLSRLISAQEAERKRIARELHDGVGQALTSIIVHLKVLAQNQDPTTQARMAELRQLTDETLAEVRLLSRQLRPSALDDLGLAAALERYATEFRLRYPTVEVDLHCTLPNRLAPDVETSLYRIIQEAMSNAARHSQATSLSVLVNARTSTVHAIIEDNGTGFDVASMRRAGSSVGLHSMTERSELLNGSLEIESSATGTTVYVEIPLDPTPPLLTTTLKPEEEEWQPLSES